MHVSHLDQIEPYVTLDGSTIREVAHPASSPVRHQSLAEASILPGGETAEHYHLLSEELYFFTSGSGRMRLSDTERSIAAGDCVVIPVGERHKLWNTGSTPLVLLCCCSPPYSHKDIFLTEQD